MIAAFLRWLIRATCAHAALTLDTTGAALVTAGGMFFPGVQITCSRCGEFWHAELDAGAAVEAGLKRRAE